MSARLKVKFRDGGKTTDYEWLRYHAQILPNLCDVFAFPLLGARNIGRRDQKNHFRFR